MPAVSAAAPMPSRHATSTAMGTATASGSSSSLSRFPRLSTPSLDDIYLQLDKEQKIREGAQSILLLIEQDAFAGPSPSSSSSSAAGSGAAAPSPVKLPSAGAAAALRSRVEAELYAAEERILALQAQVQAYPSMTPPLLEEPLQVPQAYYQQQPRFQPYHHQQQGGVRYQQQAPLQYVPSHSGPTPPPIIDAEAPLPLPLPLGYASPSASPSPTANTIPLSSVGGGSASEDSATDDESEPEETVYIMDSLLDTLMRRLAESVRQEMRTKTYRLLAQILTPSCAPFMARCRSRGLDIYLCRTLARDAKYDLERIEALRLVRRANELSEHTRDKRWHASQDDENDGEVQDPKGKRRSYENSGTSVRRRQDTLDPDEPERWLRAEREEGIMDDLPFSPALVRTLASVVGEEKDKLRWLCLETLAELAIRHPHLVHLADAFGVLVQALRSGPPEYIPNLVQVVLFLLDTPTTRAYLRPGFDLELALSAITDVPFKKPPGYEAEVRMAAKAISVILHSWSGLLYLCMFRRRAIGSIVKVLLAGTRESKSALIAMLQDLFELAQGQVTTPTFAPGSSVANVTPNILRSSDSRSTINSGIGMQTPVSPPSQTVPLPSSIPKVRPSNVRRGRRLQAATAPARPNLLEQYATLLLAIFVDAGLIDALVHTIQAMPETLVTSRPGTDDPTAKRPSAAMMTLPTVEELELAEKKKDGEMGRQAVRLLGTIAQVARRVLPLDYTLCTQKLPHLFALAARLQPDALPSGQELKRNYSDSARHPNPPSPTPDEGSRRVQQQRAVDMGKVRAAVQMDDAQFRNLLLESQVLTHKEHTKWNLAAIYELLEGPLMNPRRLEDVARGTKLVRRLLSFFHPSEQRFALLPNTAANRKYVRLGCTMIRTFLATAEGVKILSEDMLLREIRTGLEQLDPLSMGPSGAPMPTDDQLMSKTRVEETLTGGYFEMLGVLSSVPEGLELLSRVQMFTVLYNLSGIQSRDYLIREVIKHFDYSIDGHTRIILSKVLTSTYISMRIFATRILTGLIADSIEPSQWLIALLLTQLYDTAPEVRELAARAVMQACASPAVLELVVSMRPTLEHLGEDSQDGRSSHHPLLLRFMSTSNGFRFLFQGDYISREMEEWLVVRNLRYAVQLERMLAQALSVDQVPGAAALPPTQRAFAMTDQGADITLNRSGPDDGLFAPESLWQDILEPFDGTIPPHFYGELAKTPEGCTLLDQKGHFSEFAAFLRRHAKECEDVEVIAKLKSVLWTVGNIGATHRGLGFLEAEDIISIIVEIAERSQVLSVRGVAFFVISMIASTSHGADVLNDYGWRTAWTSMGLPSGVCIPDDIDRFVEIEPWTPMRGKTRTFCELMPPTDSIERDILSALSELGNRIVAKLAHRELVKLKARYPEYFEDTRRGAGGQSPTATREASRSWNSGSGARDSTGGDANMTPTIGSYDDASAHTSSMKANGQAHSALKNTFPETPSKADKRLRLLVRALELLDHYPLPLSMRRIVWDLFEIRLDAALVRDLARTRSALIEERKAHLAQGEAVRLGEASSNDLQRQDHSRSAAIPPSTGIGPGTIAYGTIVGLRDLAVGGGRVGGAQAQRYRRYQQATQGQDGGGGEASFVAPGVVAAMPGGATANVVQSPTLHRAGGVVGVESVGLMLDGEDEEEGDDSDEDESELEAGIEQQASLAGVPDDDTEGAVTRGGGPAVVISTATVDTEPGAS